ncbi:MAG: (2Fe-2S)-binding protein [Pseudobdellovibrionaceae bacterium]
MAKAVVQLESQDRIEVLANQKLSVKGCHELRDLILGFKSNHGDQWKTWPPPQGQTHSEILLRQFLLEQRGEWNPPYTHEEICHCRAVPTREVEKAIIMGAHTTQKVSRWTSASTACGTCRPDVEKMISYFLSSGTLSGNEPVSK